MADYPAWPGTTRPNLPTQKPSWRWRNISLFTFLAGQTRRNRCWIKGLGKNPQKEWARSLFAVPFVRGLPSVTRWTPRNVALIIIQICSVKSFTCIHPAGCSRSIGQPGHFSAVAFCCIQRGACEMLVRGLVKFISFFFQEWRKRYNI